MQWLREHFPSSSFWLSYPYGITTRVAERLAERLGYQGGVRIEGGWYRPHRDERFAVPRLNIPSGISLKGFVLRAAGVITA
jgi:hypothetical protein